MVEHEHEYSTSSAREEGAKAYSKRVTGYCTDLLAARGLRGLVPLRPDSGGKASQISQGSLWPLWLSPTTAAAAATAATYVFPRS